MSMQTASWHYCVEAETLLPGKITEVLAGERVVCLLRRDEKVYAFVPLCPHAGGRLCDGWIDPQGRVVCPLHKYRFNPANGYNTSGEGYKLKTYPVKEEEGRIFVQF